MKQTQNFFIRHEISALHDFRQFFAFVRSGSYFGSKQIASAKVAKTEFIDDFSTLCAFATAWASQNPNNWNIAAGLKCHIKDKNRTLYDNAKFKVGILSTIVSWWNFGWNSSVFLDML